MTENQKCSETGLLMDDYISGNLAEAEKRSFEKHLLVCSDCKREFEETLRLIDKISSLPKEIKPGRDLWKGVRKKMVRSNIKEISSNNGLPGLSENMYSGNVKVFRWKYAITGIAALFLLFGILYLLNTLNYTPPKSSIISVDLVTTWPVSKIKGSPMIGNKAISETDSLKIGEWLTTDDSSSALLNVSGLGTVRIEPNTKVKILKSSEGEHRLMLEHGTVDADITSKPRSFFVEAGSVTAVDLGCEYTFTVDTTGDGLLFVRDGKVSLESPGRASLVQAGKVCITRKDIGPGTPFNYDSSPEFKKALMNFDFGSCGGSCVNTMLKSAEKNDAETLLLIFPKVDDDYKEKVYAKVSNYVPPPRHIDPDSIPQLDIECINEWIEKVQIHVQRTVEKSMKDMEKNLKELNKMNFEIDIQELEKDTSKALKIKILKNKGREHGRHDEEIKIHIDTLHFDKEQFKEDMRKLKIELDQMNEELKLNNDELENEIRIEIEKANEEIRKANIEIDKEMKDIRIEIEEIEKDKKLKEEPGKDSKEGHPRKDETEGIDSSRHR